MKKIQWACKSSIKKQYIFIEFKCYAGPTLAHDSERVVVIFVCYFIKHFDSHTSIKQRNTKKTTICAVENPLLLKLFRQILWYYNIGLFFNINTIFAYFVHSQ